MITGITGQDGSYLAEFLLQKGYEVHGIIRRSSSFNTGRIDHIFSDIALHYGDMTDEGSIGQIISTVNPDWVFNLAAQSHVNVSFDIPKFTTTTDALGCLAILETVKRIRDEGGKSIRVYQASSSEMFGNAPPKRQAGFNENSKMVPVSPYGAAKLYAHTICQVYRASYNLDVVNGILFNHESPRRGGTFLPQKVCNFVRKAKANDRYIGPLEVGNIHAVRDWSHAKDMVRGMFLMMDYKRPDDWILASGRGYTVKQLIDYAFAYIGVELNWYDGYATGNGIGDAKDYSFFKWVTFDNPRFQRPNELHWLIGDCTKARNLLDWKPEYNFQELIIDMINGENINGGKSD